jgi:hypothetical protein
VTTGHPVPASVSGTLELVTELHVLIPDEIAERLAERAEREHTTPEQLASDAVRSYVGPPPRTGVRPLGFIGLGHSGRSDLSERVKEIRQASFEA